jgi:CBS domain-containing protein
MKDIQVKELMISISNYVIVKKENSLIDVLQALDADRKSKTDHAHRDAIVVDGDGNFIGKLTMIDIFRALEPNYKKIDPTQSTGGLTKKFVMDAARDFRLWMEPMQDVSERGKNLKVADVMHAPEDVEYIQESDTLEKALNEFVMGVHQPLIVKNDDEVTGVLRFGDLFEVVRDRLLSNV